MSSSCLLLSLCAPPTPETPAHPQGRCRSWRELERAGASECAAPVVGWTSFCYSLLCLPALKRRCSWQGSSSGWINDKVQISGPLIFLMDWLALCLLDCTVGKKIPLKITVQNYTCDGLLKALLYLISVGGPPKFEVLSLPCPGSLFPNRIKCSPTSSWIKGKAASLVLIYGMLEFFFFPLGRIDKYFTISFWKQFQDQTACDGVIEGVECWETGRSIHRSPGGWTVRGLSTSAPLRVGPAPVVVL